MSKKSDWEQWQKFKFYLGFSSSSLPLLLSCADEKIVEKKSAKGQKMTEILFTHERFCVAKSLMIKSGMH